MGPAPQRGTQSGLRHGCPMLTTVAPSLGWEGTTPFKRTFMRLLQIVAIIAILPIFATAQQAPPAPAPRFVVVLDAAHGGDDAGGTISTQSGQSGPEKAYTLALSVRLRSLLAARGISVVTTREADTALDAQHRAEIANHAQAQACLSLHASASGSGIQLHALENRPGRLHRPQRRSRWSAQLRACACRHESFARAHSNRLHRQHDLPRHRHRSRSGIETRR